MALTLPRVLGADGQLGARLVQLAFDTIAKSLVDTGGKAVKVRFGSGTLTWAGVNQFSDTTVVSHGLGGTPVAVVHGYLRGAVPLATLSLIALDSDSFDIAAETTDGSTPANTRTDTFYWIAVG